MTREEVEREAFEKWFELVDNETFELCGVSIHELPECSFRDWFEDGMSAADAAYKAAQYAGFDTELF